MTAGDLREVPAPSTVSTPLPYPVQRAPSLERALTGAILCQTPLPQRYHARGEFNQIDNVSSKNKELYVYLRYTTLLTAQWG